MSENDQNQPARDASLPPAPRVDSFAHQAFRRIADRREGREKPVGFPWPSLNTAMNGGIWPGVHIVSGGVGVGKTQWALQLALHAAQQGTPVLYVTLDLDELGLVARLASLLSDHHWSTLYRGDTDKLAEIENKTRSVLQGLPIHLEVAHPFAWSGPDLVERIEAIRSLYSLSDSRPLLAVVDYLQLALCDHGDLRRSIATTAYHARRAARSHHAAVLLISSVAREHSLLANLQKTKEPGRITPIPLTASGPHISPELFKGIGAETSEIEYSADTVLCLCREPRDPDTPSEDLWVAVAKKRAGNPEWVRLLFDGSAFSDPRNGSG